MLELYGRIGRALHGIRVFLWLGTVAGVGFFVAAMVDATEGLQETRMLLPLLACLWSLFMLVFAYGFSGEIPVVDSAESWWRRLRKRIKRALWHLMALTMTGLGLATVLVSLRTLTIIRGELAGQ